MNYLYVLAVFAGRSVTLLGVLVLAYVLDPHAFGIYTLAATNALLVQLIAGTWLSMAATKLLSTDEEDRGRSALSRVASIALIIMVAEAMIGVVIIWAGEPVLDARIVAATVLWSISLLWFELTLALKNAQQQAAGYVGLSIRRSIFAITLSIIFARSGYGALGAIVGQILGTVTAIASSRSTRLVWAEARIAAVPLPMLRAMFAFGIVSAIGMGLYIEINSIGRNMVVPFFGEAAAGHFSLASDFFYGPMTLLATSYSLSKIPELFRVATESIERQRAMVAAVLRTTCFFALPYLAGGLAIGASVARTVMPPISREEITVLATPAIVQAALLTMLYAHTTILMTMHRVKLLFGIVFLLLGLGGALMIGAATIGDLASVLWGSCVAIAAVEIALILWLHRDPVLSLPLRDCGKIAAASVAVYGAAKLVTLFGLSSLATMIGGTLVGIIVYLSLALYWSLVDLVEILPPKALLLFGSCKSRLGPPRPELMPRDGP